MSLKSPEDRMIRVPETKDTRGPGQRIHTPTELPLVPVADPRKDYTPKQRELMSAKLRTVYRNVCPKCRFRYVFPGHFGHLGGHGTYPKAWKQASRANVAVICGHCDATMFHISTEVLTKVDT